jgi:hypothetical protein
MRLVRNPKRPGESPTLDIREYISSETFEGSRGAGSGWRPGADGPAARRAEGVLEAGGFAKPAPGLMPAQ